MVNGINPLDGTLVKDGSKTKHHKLADYRGNDPIKYVILSHTCTNGSVSDAQRTMFDNGASAHILIARDGRLTQAYPYDTIKTFMAGFSGFKNDTLLNKYSINVLLGNKGFVNQKDFYSETQVETIVKLVATGITINGVHSSSLLEEFPSVRILELGEVATQKHIALGNYFPREILQEAIRVKAQELHDKGVQIDEFLLKSRVVLPENVDRSCMFKINNTGDKITEIQTKLADLGYTFNNNPLNVSGVFDEPTINVANMFNKVHVPYTMFTLQPIEDGSTENYYVPNNADLLVENVYTGPKNETIDYEKAGINPATPHCWTGAMEFTINHLLGLPGTVSQEINNEGDSVNS